MEKGTKEITKGEIMNNIIKNYPPEFTGNEEKIKGYVCSRCGDDIYKHSECSKCEEHNAEYGSCYFGQCFNCDEDVYKIEVIKKEEE